MERREDGGKRVRGESRMKGGLTLEVVYWHHCSRHCGEHLAQGGGGVLAGGDSKEGKGNGDEEAAADLQVRVLDVVLLGQKRIRARKVNVLREGERRSPELQGSSKVETQTRDAGLPDL